MLVTDDLAIGRIKENVQSSEMLLTTQNILVEIGLSLHPLQTEEI